MESLLLWRCGALQGFLNNLIKEEGEPLQICCKRLNKEAKMCVHSMCVPCKTCLTKKDASILKEVGVCQNSVTDLESEACQNSSF